MQIRIYKKGRGRGSKASLQASKARQKCKLSPQRTEIKNVTLKRLRIYLAAEGRLSYIGVT